MGHNMLFFHKKSLFFTKKFGNMKKKHYICARKIIK